MRTARLVPSLVVVAFLLGSTLPAAARGRRRPPAKKSAGHKAPHRRGRAPAPVPALTSTGLPNVLSAASVAADLDTGVELYGKSPGAVRPIASVGKLFVALTVRDKLLPLDGQTTITEEDKSFARGGARSRLMVGKTFTNRDLLRAMLISSDNRAVTALGRAVGLSPVRLVAAVNARVKQLGLTKTHFTDPTGINGNVSTPREVLLALRAALDDPVIAGVLATPSAVVQSTSEPRAMIQYFSTNLPLRAGNPAIIGGKTGYTDEARYCLAIAATLGGRRVGMVFLGAEGELTRFGDYSRVAQWLEARAAREATGAGAASPPTASVQAVPPMPGDEGVGAAALAPPAALTPRLVR